MVSNLFDLVHSLERKGIEVVNFFRAACVYLLLQSAETLAKPSDIIVVGDITLEDVHQSVIAFVTTSSTPGLDGAEMSIRNSLRSSKLLRSSLGFAADIGLKNSVVDLHWGAAITGGAIDEELSVEDSGREVSITVDRDVAALRGSFGLSIPVNSNVRFRPYLTGFYSMVSSRSDTRVDIQSFSDIEASRISRIGSDFDAISGALTMELDWHRWFKNRQMTALVQYNLTYTDTDSENTSHLDTWGWNQVAIVKTRMYSPLGLKIISRDTNWFTYLNYTHFIDLPKISLGFTHFYELGIGSEWNLHIKPLDWFGFRSFGLKAGYIFDDDVSGFNIGFVVQ